jgi:hypothetical protein
MRWLAVMRTSRAAWVSVVLTCALGTSAGCSGGGSDATGGTSSTAAGGGAASSTSSTGSGNAGSGGAGTSTSGAGGGGGGGGTSSGGMSVSGNQLLKDGAPFYGRGFNMIGLLSPDACPNPPGAGNNARMAFGQAELELARDEWHANILRFQISQRGMDPQDAYHTQAYVDRVVAGVTLARSLGFVVITSMQDQSIGCGSAHPLPFDATLRAWSTLGPLFQSDPYVMFEVFNEPVTLETPAGWVQWRDGGLSPVTDNQGEGAIGHQAIVDHIRSLGATNVLIADGANRGGKLQNLYPDHLLLDPLGAPQIVYAIHPYYFHIANNSSLATDTANWDTRFGYITPHVPVIVTEWNASASCFTGQEARIQDFFGYLLAHDIGLLAHAFDYPGTMIEDLATFTPTVFTGCNIADSDAGAILQAHFTMLANGGP